SGISFLLLGILVACSGKDQILVVPPNEGYSFEAKILKVENVLAVEPLEGESELSSKDQINVSTSEATLLNEEREEIAFTDFQVGDKVEIYYDGNIAESYPAQIHHSGRIQLLKD